MHVRNMYNNNKRRTSQLGRTLMIWGGIGLSVYGFWYLTYNDYIDLSGCQGQVLSDHWTHQGYVSEECIDGTVYLSSRRSMTPKLDRNGKSIMCR